MALADERQVHELIEARAPSSIRKSIRWSKNCNRIIAKASTLRLLRRQRSARGRDSRLVSSRGGMRRRRANNKPFTSKCASRGISMPSVDAVVSCPVLRFVSSRSGGRVVRRAARRKMYRVFHRRVARARRIVAGRADRGTFRQRQEHHRPAVFYRRTLQPDSLGPNDKSGCRLVSTSYRSSRFSNCSPRSVSVRHLPG